MYLVGTNQPNIIGHIQPNTPGSPDRLDSTPGSLRFSYARNIVFQGNVFEHLGSVALDFDTGSQGNLIQNNCFDDISSSAIQIGGIAEIDNHQDTTSAGSGQAGLWELYLSTQNYQLAGGIFGGPEYQPVKE
jgi:hypothetical protein